MAYKWDNPQEWLLNKIENSNDLVELHHILSELACNTDGDTIQNLFQDIMDEDGYFAESIFEDEDFIIYKEDEQVTIQYKDEENYRCANWDERFKEGLIYNEENELCFQDGVRIEEE